MAERRLRGTPAAPGVVVGRVLRYTPVRITIDRELLVSQQAIEAELARFQQAVAQVRGQITAAQMKAATRVGDAEAAIFDAHQLILDDPLLAGEVDRRIRDDHQRAEAAIVDTASTLRAQLEQIEGSPLGERAADVADVANQLLRALSGGQEAVDLSEVPEHTIIVAEEIYPSDMTLFNRDRVVGLVTARGSRTDHAAILARSLEMAAVAGLEGVVDQVEDGEGAIVDGDWGEFVLSPETETLTEFQGRLNALRQERASRAARGEMPALTTDNVRITLLANISSSAEAKTALEHGAEGVGLFRTEFFFLDRPTPPSEEEQYQAYRQVAETMAHRPVAIRTLDAGGDKPVAGISLPAESNPFLGTRGLRLSLRYPDLFRTQIRAILRAAASGNIWLMLPMVATLQDLRDARQVIDGVKGELNHQQLPYREDIPVGIMIETPAAAITADLLIRECDFLSIGTNDLVQYTLAVDRTNHRLASRYDPLDVSVVRLISQAVTAAEGQGKPIAVCGELAGDPQAIPLLIGLGIRELSMNAPSLAQAKDTIRSIRLEDAAEAARQRVIGPVTD